MDISKVSALGAVREGRTAPAQKPDQRPRASGHGLVPVAPAREGSSLRHSPRPLPAFLAQLIATAQHAPQTRARGRAEPADAIARYSSVVSANVPAKTWDWSV